MTEIQNSLLRDAMLAMKSVEKTLESSVQAVHGMEKTIASLQFSVNNIDQIFRRMTDTGMVPRKSSPTSSVEENAS